MEQPLHTVFRLIKRRKTVYNFQHIEARRIASLSSVALHI